MSERSDATFRAWREEFRKIDACPWPGPRPLREDDSTLLIGRDADLKRFRCDVDGHKLIVLAGASGVGKSSLLEAGLIPDLKKAGYRIAICNDYSGEVPENQPASFIAGKVHAQFNDIPDLPTGARMFPHLQRVLGERGIIILDQFEELIRYAPTQKQRVFDFLLALNHDFDTKVIISMRSEFLHELRTVERGVRSFSLTRVTLEDLDPIWAKDVVEAPNKKSKSEVIAPELADRIAGCWRIAQEHTGGENIIDPFGRIGLLHLQAFLYTLDYASDGQPLSKKRVDSVMLKLATALRDQKRVDLDTLRVDDEVGRVSDDGELMANAFRGALLGSISVKLERCRRAAAARKLDEFLIEGTTALVAQAAPHLSSAGYKLIREANALASVTLGRDHENLLRGTARRCMQQDAGSPGDPEWDLHPEEGQLDERQYAALLNRTVSLLGMDEPELDVVGACRREIATFVDDSCEGVDSPTWLERLHGSAPPWVADPMEVTCGPMSGMAPAAVVMEEIRRFWFALAWLRESSLIRITKPGMSNTMVSLIHDGFGVALQNWASGWSVGPDGPLHALTAPLGANYAWAYEGDERGVVGDSGPRVVANVRWRGGWVCSPFEQVVFVNCDLRGAMFDRCSFKGVAFVNCLLDGVILSECVFHGIPAAVTEAWNPEISDPEFVVPASKREVETLGHYQQRDVTVDALWSPLPGAPCVPASANQESAVPLRLDPGGVTIYGGRVSSFVVRHCDFSKGDGGLSFRYANGSGLELVEMRGGDIEVYGCAIRHLTLSKRVIGETQNVSVKVSGSFVAQLWISQGVTGTLVAEDCKFLQAWNESQVQAIVKESSVYGLLGITAIDCDHMSVDAEQPADLDSTGVLRRLTQQMDYRRNPAQEAALRDR